MRRSRVRDGARFFTQGPYERLQCLKQDGGRHGLSILVRGVLKLGDLKPNNFALGDGFRRSMQVGQGLPTLMSAVGGNNA